MLAVPNCSQRITSRGSSCTSVCSPLFLNVPAHAQRSILNRILDYFKQKMHILVDSNEQTFFVIMNTYRW